MSVQKQPASDDSATASSRTMFAAMCGITMIAGLVIVGLGHEGFFEDAAANLLLILDFPPGYALAILALPTIRSQRSVVVTSSSAPEYWNDLSDLGARIVIHGDYSTAVLAESLRHAAMGARYHLTPTLTSVLTPIQRRVLHLLTNGASCPGDRVGLRKAQPSSTMWVYRTHHRRTVCPRTRSSSACFAW